MNCDCGTGGGSSGDFAKQGASATSEQVAKLKEQTSELDREAQKFSRTITQAFASGIAGGKSFDTILKSLGQRLSGLALQMALKPVEGVLTTGISSLFKGLSGINLNPAMVGASGAVKPFASGGVIGTPTYFPMATGGVGLAGEAGPEAIMPLKRGPDGRLGVASNGGSAVNVSINIATPDAESFRRSESYVAGQIARAVARGQRSL